MTSKFFNYGADQRTNIDWCLTEDYCSVAEKVVRVTQLLENMFFSFLHKTILAQSYKIQQTHLQVYILKGLTGYLVQWSASALSTTKIRARLWLSTKFSIMAQIGKSDE